jgi:filamentous hemagglutinin family protein
MSSSKHISIISLLLMHSYCFSLPTNEVIIAGDAQFQHQENALNIIQSSDFLHTQYDTFDIANHESVTFQQPNINSVVINQVLNSDPTSIAGQLSANGQLFVLAPGGLIIHDGASVEAASFFTSTLAVDKVTDSDIQLSASHSSHGIINNGNILINGGGSLQLLSNKIINTGTIKNKNGDVKLAVSDSALVRFSGDMFAMELDESALDGVIQNSGVISATSGNVQLNAMVRNQINELVIHNEGDIIATSAWQEGGDIYIGSNEGDIENHGLIESVATSDHDSLSHIQINSDRIANFGTIKNNALDTGNAGSIELNAEDVVVLMADSLIQANGDVAGDGGNIKVFSPKNAIFRQGANIEAQAGFQLGNGGFVDVSGWEYIEINGRVSTLALNGDNGEFLIDPYNVTISTVTNNNTFSGNTFTPNSSGSTINLTSLITNLQAGDVTVVTTGAGAESGDISLSVNIDLDGTNGNTLSLIADGSIILNGSISDNNPATADATNIVLQALNGTINPGANTVESGGGSIELKTNGNVTIGTGGNIDLTKFDSEGGSLTVESTAGTLSLLSDFDLDGYNGNTINFKASSDINLDFDVRDLTTASADSVGLGFISTSGDVLLAGGKVVQSSGGAISIEAASSITVGTGGYVDLANFDSEGGSLTIESTGGALTLLNDLDLDGRSGSILTLQADTDLNLNFNIADSVTGSVDSVALSLIAGNDINIAAGKSVNSYGNLITFNANNNIALTNVTTGGGALFLSAINITDAGDTGSGYDINAGGGVVSFNYSGDVGGSSTATAIEINDSIIDLSFYGSAQNFFVSAAGAQDLTIRDVDYNGTTTFNFNGSHTGTGSFNFSGDFSDSNDSGDVATINVNTTGVASHINVASSASLRTRGGDLTFITADATSNITIGSSAIVRSQGGDITYDAGGDIGITYTKSDGGGINLTAQNIYDNGNVRSDIAADGGVVTINSSGNVGGTSSATGLEIEDATIDFTATSTNQNLYLNALGSNALTFNSIDYNGVGTFNVGVSHDGTGDIIVTGDIYDGNTGSLDNLNINLATNSITSDITINDSTTIRSGDAGSITLDSANDIYLTGVFGSTGGTIITAANDIIDNGDITLDVQSTGAIILEAGRHMADGDILSIKGTTLNLNLGSGNQNILVVDDIILGNIEVDGANGAQVSIVGNSDIDITGPITDANGADDLIDLTLGTSSPGFLIFPDAGYTVPGSLSFWSGTSGIRDSTGERISITANSVISSGNNFLLNTGPVIFDLTVDDIDFRDDTGGISFEINNSKNLRIADLDGDGEFLLGKEFKLNVNGDLAVPDLFIDDVDDQLWIIANDIDDPDADNIFTIRDSGDAGSDFNLIVELTDANDVHINTDISDFDGTVAAGGTLTIDNTLSSGLDLSTDLNSDGAFINGAGNLILATQGTLTLADDGIHTAGHLFLTADDIMDSDNEISLSGANVFLQLDAPTANLYTLNLAADKFDATLTGSNNGLVVNASQDLFIQDLNSDGNSLNISDGYAWIDVAGSVSIDNTVSIIDSNVDGTENGWLYLGYEGSAQLGMNGGLTMQIDGSLEAGTPGALDVANSQLIIRQTGASNTSNTLQLDDANITVTGGDAIFDITNNTGNVTGYGDIQTSTNTAITVLNAAGDTPLTQPTYDGLSINGSLNVATGRAIGFNGYNLAIAEPEPEPEPEPDNEINDQINDAVADVINETVEDSGQTVTNDIQEETVDSVESTPNVNFALNATYGDCQASNKDDPRCRLKDEMSRFLGQFLMGGSMIKAK